MKRAVYILCLLSLFGYVFIADFLIALLGIAWIKLFFALGTLLFGVTYCALNYSNLKYKEYLWASVFFLAFYFLVIHNTVALNLIYTAIFGFILVQNQKISNRFIDIVFLIQFILVLYEFITHSIIYTEVSTGLFSVTDYDYKGGADVYTQESGFRPKGLFPGTLISTAFTIYYSCINRNSINKTFFSFVTATLLNGRMAMLTTFVLFVWCYYVHGSKALHFSQASRRKIIVFFSVLLGAVLVALSTSVVQISRLFEVFDFTADDNFGRIFRYILGIQEYVTRYGVVQKLFGSSYELYDIYGRVVPPESELVGMFLEIGLLGFCLYLIPMIKAWRESPGKIFEKKYVSIKLVLLLTVICMIQYRHFSGNQRGIMFWYMTFSIFVENELHRAPVWKPRSMRKAPIKRTEATVS